MLTLTEACCSLIAPLLLWVSDYSEKRRRRLSEKQQVLHAEHGETLQNNEMTRETVKRAKPIQELYIYILSDF